MRINNNFHLESQWIGTLRHICVCRTNIAVNIVKVRLEFAYTRARNVRFSFLSPISHNLVLEVTNSSQICLTFLARSDSWKLSWEGFETGSRHPRRLCDYFERTFVLRIFWTFKKKLQIPVTYERITATHARKLITSANISRHFGNSFANAVCNLSPTVTAQWDRGLTMGQATKSFTCTNLWPKTTNSQCLLLAWSCLALASAKQSLIFMMLDFDYFQYEQTREVCIKKVNRKGQEGPQAEAASKPRHQRKRKSDTD